MVRMVNLAGKPEVSVQVVANRNCNDRVLVAKTLNENNKNHMLM